VFVVAGRNSNGYVFYKPVQEHVKVDEIYNYSSQLCHWFLHYMSMDDTAKEGDIDRLVANC